MSTIVANGQLIFKTLDIHNIHYIVPHTYTSIIILYTNILCKYFHDTQKLTALLEYLDLEKNFHAINFRMIAAYEIYFTTKTKQIMVQLTLVHWLPMPLACIGH